MIARNQEKGRPHHRAHGKLDEQVVQVRMGALLLLLPLPGQKISRMINTMEEVRNRKKNKMEPSMSLI